MHYVVAAIIVVLLGLFIGVPYVQAYRRRQELIRRGRIKQPTPGNEKDNLGENP